MLCSHIIGDPMLITPDPNVESALTLLSEVRANLDRIESLLRPSISHQTEELDPKSPLNKNGTNLTARGVEVAYRMFDAGKTRYAVSEALEISYGAASYRLEAWEKIGGKKRERKPL